MSWTALDMDPQTLGTGWKNLIAQVVDHGSRRWRFASHSWASADGVGLHCVQAGSALQPSLKRAPRRRVEYLQQLQVGLREPAEVLVQVVARAQSAATPLDVFGIQLEPRRRGNLHGLR